ncbi:MAG: 30S ribosomal protein S3 [candidate division WS2 bacterium ADurb.Bin280]|uniref:Small ribosomal subunit protein uS3 n=1 Tax=candidate division WS2 bacterium ADurb.Bin280 TaxID=1852829 RepID=A0A1V5SEW6_9BACT|nr:MAG: 30S ribosomal protein S3 [candidate division WS2 bacterium ADurb.Bin280]
MGQKVNPIGYRLAVYNNWKSKWFARGNDFSKNIIEDWKIRDTISKKIGIQGGISDIVIERAVGRVIITIVTARPGIVIGRSGKQLEQLRGALAKKLNYKFKLEVVEVKKPDLDASVVAQQLGVQIGKRMSFRRLGKQIVQKVMDAGAKGVMVKFSGRLDGAEIARSESFSLGSVPLTTLRSDIDFAVCHAQTTFGIVGIKVWINRGEKVQ